MADQDKITPQGRDKATHDAGRPERYPPVKKDDSAQAEGRSFGRHGAPPSTQEGRLGPEGDPAEGKR